MAMFPGHMSMIMVMLRSVIKQGARTARSTNGPEKQKGQAISA